jgi:lysyl-tRNA synthetase class II
MLLLQRHTVFQWDFPVTQGTMGAYRHAVTASQAERITARNNSGAIVFINLDDCHGTVRSAYPVFFAFFVIYN